MKDPTDIGQQSLLGDWPYAANYLLQVLDPDLIESHAVNMLSRALNIGRTIAFVGAGASMSYGRLSWGGLVQTQIETMKREYKTLRADSVPQHIKILYETLIRLTNNRSVRSEHYPMLFQICEQLQVSIKTHREQSGPTASGDGEDIDDSVPRQSQEIRSATQEMLLNDLGHARKILTDVIRCDDIEDIVESKHFNHAEPSHVRKQDDRADIIYESVTKKTVPFIYSKKIFLYLLKHIKQYYQIHKIEFTVAPAIIELEKHYSEDADKNRSGTDAGRMLYVDRFLFGALLLALPQAPRWRIVRIGLWYATRRSQSISGVSSKNRSDRVPSERDPLLLLYRRLKIERFITTNYDHEIEQMLGDSGLREVKSDPDHDEEQDLQASMFDSTVFSSKRSADLFEFTARERRGRAGVFHLHGRAEENPTNGKIIVTERDYQLQYAVLDDTRDMVDAAIRTAFAASPMLFVGSNMGEDDVLRPLRQFMGAPNKLGDRVAIALLPRLAEQAAIDEAKIALLARYGVYAIHFGLASFESHVSSSDALRRDAVAGRREGLKKSSFWLPWIWNIKTSLEEILKLLTDLDRLKPKNFGQQRRKAQARLKRWELAEQASTDPKKIHDIEERVRYFREQIDRIDEDEKDDPAKRDAYFGELREKLDQFKTKLRRSIETEKDSNIRAYFKKPEVKSDPPTLNSPMTIELIDVDQTKSRETPDVSLEVELLNATLRFVWDLSDRLPPIQFYLSKDSQARWGMLWRAASCHLAFLQGLGDSMMASFTCARLARAQWEWETWRSEWLRAPRPRNIWKFEIGHADSKRSPQDILSPKEKPSTVDPHPPHLDAVMNRSSSPDQVLDERPLRFWEDRLDESDGGELEMHTSERLTFNIYLWHGASLADGVEELGTDTSEGVPPSQQTSSLDGQEQRFGRRFYEDAPSQALNGLLSALTTKDGAAFCKRGGRRFLVLVSPRGVGKGHMFSVLQGAKRNHSQLERLLNALTLQPNRTDAKHHWTCALFNLSFAHDVMSPVDRIIDILEFELLKASPNVKRKQIVRSLNSLAHDRLGRLRYVLDTWIEVGYKPKILKKRGQAAPSSNSTSRRVLIALNAAGLFFERNGSPKNGQVKRLFDLFVDEKYRQLPIDFLLLCDSDRVPLFLRQRSPKHLIRAPIDQQRLYEVQALFEKIQRSALQSETPVRNLGLGLKSKREIVDSNKPAVAFHILHITRAIILGSAFFPRAILLLARRELIRLSDRDGTTNHGHDIFKDPLGKEIRQAIRALQIEIENQGDSAPFQIRDLSPLLYAWFATEYEFGKFAGDDQGFPKKIEEITKFVRDNAKELRKLDSSQNRSPIVRILEDGRFKKLLLTEENRKPNLSQIAIQLDERLKGLSVASGRSRYGLTLIFAAAYELTNNLHFAGKDKLGEQDDETLKKNAMERVDAVDRATRNLDRFLVRLQQSLETTSLTHRFDVIYQEYMEMLKRHHDRRDRLPITMKLNPTFYDPRTIDQPAGIRWGDASGAVSNTLQFQLMHEIIQHIAIIGQPVRGATIAYCPTIQRLAQELISSLINESRPIVSDDRTSETERRKKLTNSVDYARDVPFIVCQMLGLLEYRCLVLRVSFAKAGKDQDINKARFTVHHRVQRHVFHQLGGQYNEYQNVDLYILTLYATQPSDLPRLSFDAYRQITSTIEHLIGYPEKGGWYHTYCDLHLSQRSRMLRAAFGMMRSIYSIGVLARFDQFGGIDAEDPVFGGHFERYRRMLRWVLASAARMDDEYEQEYMDAIKIIGAAPIPIYNPPLYIDEIIWIHNECAVLSMIQGRMPDARALFDVGLSLARQSVEPDALGPLNVRLLLNRAVVDIERGALGEARASLESVAKMPRELEHPVPPLIATGYLGLIEYLSGNLDLAEQRFKEAVEGLAKQGRTRAESIFTRYWADLLRVRGTNEAKEKALEKADAALRLAHEGGHEDIRHYAQLSRIKILLKLEHYAERSAEIYRALDVIERYALVIGVPRLICEVSDVRARLLLKQGERRLAITLAARALEIATMHDLKLRKVTAMGTLAMAISQRGMPQEATTLLNSALNLAKSIGHTLAQARLEQELDRTPR